MTRSSKIQYLYDPDEVARILAPYRHLQLRLRSYQQKDEKHGAGRSKHFPYARKSCRAIYRVLHSMAELLPVLEMCVKEDVEAPSLFKPAASDFWSGLSTTFLAYWFLKRGFVVESCDKRRGGARIFDVVARNAKNNFMVEVYSPREWQGLSDFMDELLEALLHLDWPYDFSFDVDIQRVRCDLGQGGAPANSYYFNPWDFSAAMGTPKLRFNKIQDILNKVLANLGPQAPPFTINTDVQGAETTTTISLTLKDISRTTAGLPRRLCGAITPLDGYAPEIMFDKIVERNIIRKMDKGQLPSQGSKGAIRVLLVDLARLDFLDGLEERHPMYRKQFLDSIACHLSNKVGATRQADLVVFARMNLAPQFIFCCASGPDAQEEIAAFAGKNKKLQVLRRHDDFLVVGEAI
jgi:hypothetical protein